MPRLTLVILSAIALLVTAIVPAAGAESPGSPVAPYVTQVADLDGDDAADYVTFGSAGRVDDNGATVTQVTRLTARSAGTGDVLWQVDVDDNSAQVLPVTLDDGPGVLAITGGAQIVGNSATASQDFVDFTLTAIDADGDIRFAATSDARTPRARVFPTGQADSGVQVQVLAERVEGLLTRDGLSDLVLLSDHTSVATPAATVNQLSLRTVDLATGVGQDSTIITQAASRMSAAAFGDVDGDGKDDVLITHTNGDQLEGFEAYSADGGFQQLWSGRAEVPEFSDVDLSADLTGDGVRDMFLIGTDQSGATFNSFRPRNDVLAIDGATGQTLFREKAVEASVVGDVGGAPGDDVLLAYGVDGQDESIVVYEAVDGAGQEIYETEFVVNRTGIKDLYLDGPDLDGDGISDARHVLNSAPSQSAIISGATGATIGSRLLGDAFVGVLGTGEAVALVELGHGVDTTRLQAIGALSGQPIWETVVPTDTRLDDARPVEASGDDTLDVLVSYVGSAHVLDGATGAVLLSY